MNLPNQLTLARLILTAGFVVVLSSSWRFGHVIGVLLFAIAGMTDYLDGEIARKRNLVTNFGRLMDPVADKVMMAAAFICLVPLHAFPAWVAVVIISREFLITGLRLLAASQGVVLPAERMGKHKTAWQIVTVSFFLGLLALAELERAGVITGLYWWAHAWHYGGAVLIALALVLTLYSGLGYLWKNRSLISVS
ncbi:MAG: pgsA [Chthoniobacter sp.]|jgi:CDP-diacylglycerol--glycerol-3-phosphate 3-phosphatidyltransferase|nr:pgsA [Chthoniobacter sp.]